MDENQKERYEKRRKIETRAKVKKFLAGVALSAVLLISVNASKQDNYEGLMTSTISGGDIRQVEVHTEPPVNTGVSVSYETEVVPNQPPVQSEEATEQDDTESIEKEYVQNPFNFEPEVWNAIEKIAPEYELPVPGVNSVVRVESNGDKNARSADGSLGVIQPNLEWHLYSFAPYLEQAGLLSELINKSADNISNADNQQMLNKFKNMDPTWKSYQDIEKVICNPETNLRVGCDYLSKLYRVAKEKYPDLPEKDQFLLAAMAYNGGPDAPEAFLSGKNSGYINLIKDYRAKVEKFWDESIEK